MTTTDTFSSGSPPPPTSRPRPVLRRSRTDRVGAGVAGGLGEYFGLDPVLFRVLFATASFFGGAGVLAYLIAWAAIPEQGTGTAPIDRFVSALRRRRVPVWLVVGVAALMLWAVAFSWWAPGHFFPVIVIAIVFVAIFARRGHHDEDQPSAATVNVAKDSGEQPGASLESPNWVGETRQWITEARTASRARRRRALPVRIATLATLVLTLAVLALVDGVTGIALPVYFWVTLGIVGLGLLVGLVLRRTPWTVAALLVPAVLGLVAFGGSNARLHDGFGQREWTPTSASAIEPHYRLAFGQATLDLRHAGALDAPSTIDVTLGAGEARLLVPPTMNVTVHANVRIGEVTLNGSDLSEDRGGFNLNRTILAPDGASGAALTIDVHVADGRISIERG